MTRDESMMIEDKGGWISGSMVNRSALRVEHVPDGDLIEISDGSQQDPLLSMTVRQAAGLVEDLSAVLDVIGWPA
jgi:hypothetical protein